MRDLSFNLDSNNYLTLQGQIRNFLIEAILTGQLPIMAKLPSTRALAKQLKISRNTVTLAYQSLETDGVLISLPQKGYYVSDNPLAIEKTAHDYKSQEASNKIAEEKPKEKINWQDRLNAISPYDAPINKPENWRDYPYPFLYGQADMNLFPFSAWRNCMRQAMTRKWTEKWTDDLLANDDSELVKQVAERILLARGIHVKARANFDNIRGAKCDIHCHLFINKTFKCFSDGRPRLYRCAPFISMAIAKYGIWTC